MIMMRLYNSFDREFDEYQMLLMRLDDDNDFFMMIIMILYNRFDHVVDDDGFDH